MLQDLELDVAAGLGGAAEHGRAANDDRPGSVLARHVLDEVVERPEDARVLVRGAHERIALLLEHRRRAVDCGVDQRDDLEARAEFATGAGERYAEAQCGELTDCSKRNEWFQGPSSEPAGASVAEIGGRVVSVRTEHDVPSPYEEDIEVIGTREVVRPVV